MTRPDLPGDPWQYTTWEGAERAQLLSGAQLSLREKLVWLEEAAEWVERLEARRGTRLDRAGEAERSRS